MVAAVCELALLAWEKVDQASKALCLDPCAAKEHQVDISSLAVCCAVLMPQAGWMLTFFVCVRLSAQLGLCVP